MKETRKKLLNKRNFENITLFNDNIEVEFEQVAVFPYGKKLFCILHPVTPIPDIASDEALVFVMYKLNGEYVMELAEEGTAINVFNMYYDMLSGKRNSFAPKGILKQ